jgi:hypothetical protein
MVRSGAWECDAMLKPTPIALNPEAQKRRRARNWAVFGVLLAFVVIVYIVSIVKMSGG